MSKLIVFYSKSERERIHEEEISAYNEWRDSSYSWELLKWGFPCVLELGDVQPH